MTPPAEGRWLVASFRPCSLFSLKLSFATSSVGKSSPVPTPYAIKMALIDAAFRCGYPAGEADALMIALRETDVRISPPERAVVTNTFVKVRQEPKMPTPQEPYTASIAYRELVHHEGTWRWAFDVTALAQAEQSHLRRLLPHISYIGKRGSFIQFSGLEMTDALDDSFTQALTDDGRWTLPLEAQVLTLDDFGPEAELEVLSSYSRGRRVLRGRHRRFVDTIVPVAVESTGPGFTEYRRIP